MRQLITNARFDEVWLHIGIGAVRFPSPKEFFRQETASSPLADPVGALDEEVRTALIRDLDRALRAYTDDDSVVFPIQTWLITACRIR